MVVISVRVSDFEYDGFALSDFGFIICDFSGGGLQTIGNGSQITFNTVSTRNGEKYEHTSSQYDSCIETTFQICKNSCLYDNIGLSLKEYRDIITWLNRKQFHQFRFLDGEYADIYFDATFNISKIEIDGMIVGLELNMKTNRPFAYKEPVEHTYNNLAANTSTVINVVSDEEGFIYPDMTIKVLTSGNLTITNTNHTETRSMVINSCTANEIITIQYPIVSSSLSSHKIQNDFNWNFFRLANSFKYKENTITNSLKCNLELSYTPLIKISV